MSTDSGLTWIKNTGTGGGYAWTGVTSSSDGTKVSGCERASNIAGGGDIWTTTDSGVSWQSPLVTNAQTWSGITSSSDGTKLAAVVDGGNIWTSTDSGLTWTSRATAQAWSGIASSADGTKLAACVSSTPAGYIWMSTDSGLTWIKNTGTGGGYAWTGVTSSSDGTKVAGCVNNGYIWTTTDSGVSWQSPFINKNWTGITSSSDGTKLAAVVNPGSIWTFQTISVNIGGSLQARTLDVGGNVLIQGELDCSGINTTGTIFQQPATVHDLSNGSALTITAEQLVGGVYMELPPSSLVTGTFTTYLPTYDSLSNELEQRGLTLSPGFTFTPLRCTNLKPVSSAKYIAFHPGTGNTLVVDAGWTLGGQAGCSLLYICNLACDGFNILIIMTE